MFDIVRNNRRLVQVFLVLITLPFAFFGVESYMRSAGAGVDVAKVGDGKITPQEFREALLKQQNMLRESARGRSIPPAMLDTPEMRSAVLEMLINRRLLLDYAKQARFVVTDQTLSGFIASVPALQVDGKFSQQRYENAVAAQNMTKEGFEAKLRQELLLQQAAGGLSASSIAGKASGGLWRNALLEQRDVASVELKPERYLPQVKLAADAVKSYYDAHHRDFEIPQQVKAEFVILSQSALLDQTSVSDAEIKAIYDGHADRYQQGEERRASHILINVDKGASDAKVAEAKAKADALLAKLKRNPRDFANLAKSNSQDTGSAANGGDIDWFARGATTKVFEDTAFALKEGEISDVVRSDFGFHIIKVTGIRPARGKSLEQARGEIEAELKQQAVAKKYAEAVEAFTNTVYEQPDSLKPAADKFGLTIQQSNWISKGVAGSGLASNPKLLAALFSDDAIRNKRNTEAIEVAPNTLVSARVIESKPAAAMPFDDVKAAIEKQLTLDEARKLAASDGELQLAKLRKGEGSPAWGESKRIARIGGEKMPRPVLDAIFKASTATLPAYAGAVSVDGGYTLYRISQVIPFNGGDDQHVKALQEQYAQVVAGEEFAAWLGVLRERAGVEINEKVLQAKE